MNKKITIKEYLAKVKCKKCENVDKSKMELYFVAEREHIEHPVIITKYLSCQICGEVYKIDDKDKTKEYLLEPVLSLGS